MFYDQKGKFVGVRRPGSNRPIFVDGMNIVVDDAIGRTSLELEVSIFILLVCCFSQLPKILILCTIVKK